MVPWCLCMLLVGVLVGNTHGLVPYSAFSKTLFPQQLESNYYNDQVGPGARAFPASWVDGNGNYWLFGGYGNGLKGYYCGPMLLNDMWMYNTTSKAWNFIDTGPGPQSLAAPVTWQHTDGNGKHFLYMYSGCNSTSDTYFDNKEFLLPTSSDMWRFDVAAKSWQQVNSTALQIRIPSHANELDGYPGGRIGSAAWFVGTDLILFGGKDYIGALRVDMWKYDTILQKWWYATDTNTGTKNANTQAQSHIPACFMWASVVVFSSNVFLIGGRGKDTNNIFTNGLDTIWLFNGTWNLYSTMPSGYSTGTAWFENNGLVLFGGRRGDNLPINTMYFLDFYNKQYSVLTDEISGPAATYGFARWPQGIYGGFDVSYAVSSKQWSYESQTWTKLYGISGFVLPTPSPVKVPTQRYGAASWVDLQGSVWVFGGYSGLCQPMVTFLNDLWKFNPIERTWGLIKAGSRSLDADTPPGRIAPARWQTSTSLWIFGGLSSITQADIYANCELWEFVFESRLWFQRDSCTGPAARHSSDSWVYNNILYLYAGCNEMQNNQCYADVWGYNLQSMSWAPVSVGGTPPIGGLSPAWVYSHYMIAFGSYNRTYSDTTMMSFDVLNPATGWKILAPVVPGSPNSTKFPTKWSDAAGNPYITRGSSQQSDIWKFEYEASSWDSAPLSPLANLQLASVSRASYVYVFGGFSQDTSMDTNAMIRLDPCQYDNGGCGSNSVCVHNAPTVACLLISDISPLRKWTFEATLVSNNNNPGTQISATNQSYTVGKCGLGLELTGPTTWAAIGSDFWNGIENDFTLAFWAKFTTANTNNDVVIVGQQACIAGNYWAIGYRPTSQRLFFSMGVPEVQISLVSSSVAPEKLSFYSHFAVVRSGASICFYVNDSLIDCDDAVTSVAYDGLLMSSNTCNFVDKPTSMVIDDLVLYKVAMPIDSFYLSCDTTETVYPISNCMTLPSTSQITYRLTSDIFLNTAMPCFSLNGGLGIKLDGNHHKITCGASPSCVLLTASFAASLTVQNFDLYNTQVLMNGCNNVTITGNRLQEFSVNYPVYISQSSEVKFLGNILYNVSTTGIFLITTNGISVSSNAFTKCKTGVQIQSGSGVIAVNSNKFSEITRAFSAQPVVNVGTVVNVIGNEIFNSAIQQGVFSIVSSNDNARCKLGSNYIHNITAVLGSLIIYDLSNIGTSTMYDNIVMGVTFTCSVTVVNILGAVGIGMTNNTFSDVYPKAGVTCSKSIVIGAAFVSAGANVETLTINSVSSPMVGQYTDSSYIAALVFTNAAIQLTNSHVSFLTAPSGAECGNCGTTNGFNAYGILCLAGTNTVSLNSMKIEYLAGGNAGQITNYVETGHPRTSIGGNSIGIADLGGSNTYVIDGVTEVTKCNGGDGIIPVIMGNVNCTGGNGFSDNFNVSTLITKPGQYIDGGNARGLDCATSGCGHCDVNAYCAGRQCECLPGYFGNGNTCAVDLDCTANNCSANAYCTDIPGSFNCTCNSGYSGNGYICSDINECDTSPCPSNNYTCDNTPGSFTCKCAPGFDNSTGSCMDTDECATGTPCGPDQTCTNTVGNYTCFTCLRGFKVVNNQCEDIDECKPGEVKSCNSTQLCVNTPGDFYCTNCPVGYEVNSNNQCIDINECTRGTNNCTPFQLCFNLIGSYNCTNCPTGYQSNVTECVDFNECASNTTYNCSSTQICTNTVGSYNCTNCQVGYKAGPNNKCVDIDECAENTFNCSSTMFCVNTEGSYKCSPCQRGFQVGTNNQCIDINECTLKLNGGCDHHVTCQNFDGGYLCPPCPPQFTGDSYVACKTLCGDATCNPLINETCVTCPQDCNSTTCNACGDGVCDARESCSSCPEDCKGLLCGQKQCGGTPECSGNGICNDGTCVCYGNYSGKICETKPVQVNVTSNSTDPEVTITPSANTTFRVSIRAIKEITSNGDIVSAFNLTGNFSKLQNASNEWTFKTSLGNGANVTIFMQHFTAETSIKFANVTTVYPANTLKLTINITHWPFKAMTNLVGVVLDAASDEYKTQKCNIDSQTDSGGSLSWYVLNFNGVLMYGQFSPAAVVDKRNRNITFTLDPQTALVTALVPHFWEEAFLDPSYSVLIGDNSNDPCVSAQTGGSSKVSKNVYIIVFSTLGGIAAIALAAFFIIPKVRLHMKLRKEAQGLDLDTLDKAASTDTLVPPSPPLPRIERAQDMEVTTAAGRFVVKM